jgi:hypothetical protein
MHNPLPEKVCGLVADGFAEAVATVVLDEVCSTLNGVRKATVPRAQMPEEDIRRVFALCASFLCENQRHSQRGTPPVYGVPKGLARSLHVQEVLSWV